MRLLQNMADNKFVDASEKDNELVIMLIRRTKVGTDGESELGGKNFRI